MEKGAWQSTAHAVTELDTTEQLTHVEIINMFVYSYTYNPGGFRSGSAVKNSPAVQETRV